MAQRSARKVCSPQSPRYACAVANAPEPKRVAELRSFLGLVNYYGKFIPTLASTAARLHNLLRKNARWVWGKAQKAAFRGVKELLQSSDLLVHFDPEKQLILACDASPCKQTTNTLVVIISPAYNQHHYKECSDEHSAASRRKCCKI